MPEGPFFALSAPWQHMIFNSPCIPKFEFIVFSRVQIDRCTLGVLFQDFLPFKLGSTSEISALSICSSMFLEWSHSLIN